MRKLSAVLVIMCAALVLAAGTNFAQDKKAEAKDVILKGTITCAKCDLKLEKKCATVIIVKGDKKDSILYFDKESNKKFHGDTCTEAKAGTVEGTVTEADKKKIVSVKKLTYDK